MAIHYCLLDLFMTTFPFWVITVDQCFQGKSFLSPFRCLNIFPSIQKAVIWLLPHLPRLFYTPPAWYLFRLLKWVSSAWPLALDYFIILLDLACLIKTFPSLAELHYRHFKKAALTRLRRIDILKHHLFYCETHKYSPTISLNQYLSLHFLYFRFGRPSALHFTVPVAYKSVSAASESVPKLRFQVAPASNRLLISMYAWPVLDEPTAFCKIEVRQLRSSSDSSLLYLMIRCYQYFIPALGSFRNQNPHALLLFYGNFINILGRRVFEYYQFPGSTCSKHTVPIG